MRGLKIAWMREGGGVSSKSYKPAAARMRACGQSWNSDSMIGLPSLYRNLESREALLRAAPAGCLRRSGAPSPQQARFCGVRDPSRLSPSMYEASERWQLSGVAAASTSALFVPLRGCGVRARPAGTANATAFGVVRTNDAEIIGAASEPSAGCALGLEDDGPTSPTCATKARQADED